MIFVLHRGFCDPPVYQISHIDLKVFENIFWVYSRFTAYLDCSIFHLFPIIQLIAIGNIVSTFAWFGNCLTLFAQKNYNCPQILILSFIICSVNLKTLKRQPDKYSNTLKQLAGCCGELFECISPFVGLTLKGLNYLFMMMRYVFWRWKYLKIHDNIIKLSYSLVNFRNIDLHLQEPEMFSLQS